MSDKEIIEAYRVVIHEQQKVMESLSSIIQTQNDYIIRTVGFGENPKITYVSGDKEYKTTETVTGTGYNGSFTKV